MIDPVILKTPPARFDLASHFAYLGERNLKSAKRFLVNAEATFAALARTPGMGAPYRVNDPRLAGLRCCRVKQFKNHVIFYRPLADGIDVIRVLHAARDIPNALKE